MLDDLSVAFRFSSPAKRCVNAIQEHVSSETLIYPNVYSHMYFVICLRISTLLLLGGDYRLCAALSSAALDYMQCVEKDADSDEHQLILHNTLGHCSQRLGDFSKAEKHTSKALEIAEAIRGLDSDMVINLNSRLKVAKDKVGAERMYHKRALIASTGNKRSQSTPQPIPKIKPASVSIASTENNRSQSTPQPISKIKLVAVSRSGRGYDPKHWLTSDEWSYLFEEASTFSNGSMIRDVLKNGVDLVVSGHDAWSNALDISLSPRYAGWILEILLRYAADRGWDVDHVDMYFDSLVLAACFNSVDKVKDLLKYGADPNFGADKGLVGPLHMGIRLGSVDTIELLLGYGADPNAQCGASSPFDTSLAMAKYFGRTVIVLLLLKNGAKDGNVKNQPSFASVQKWDEDLTNRKYKTTQSEMNEGSGVEL